MLDTLGIGASLRETRIRLGLPLERVEASTRIRARYLEAIEDERWDELPAEAYAKGFLRTYASFLELDPQQYLAEFRARRGEAEEAIAPHPDPPYQPFRAGRRTFGTIAGALVLVLALGAWRLDGGDSDPAAVARTPEARPKPAPVTPKPAPAAKPVATRAVRPLLLTAIDDSWVEIRKGGRKGKLVWAGTLRDGRTLKLGLAKPLWILSGRPTALRASLGPKAVRVPASTTFVATARGLRRA